MEQEIYSRLAKHLDNLPGGFPPTESGVELRILKRLFTPEEAELAVYLTLIPEETQVIAGRAGSPPDETARRLEETAKKGLILRRHGGKPQVHGGSDTLSGSGSSTSTTWTRIDSVHE